MSYTSLKPLTREDAPTLESLSSLLGDLVRPIFKKWDTGARFGPSVVTAAHLADTFRFIYLLEDTNKIVWLRMCVVGGSGMERAQREELQEAIELFCEGAIDAVNAWNERVDYEPYPRNFMFMAPALLTLERKNALLMSLFPI